VRLVVDTNVVVSALRTPTGVAAAVLSRVRSGEHLVCFDGRILAEYRDVLARPRLGIPAAAAAALLADLERRGLLVADVPAAAFTLPDADDQPFLDVAVAANADAIVTGNARHFPAACGVTVLTPRALLTRLAPVGSPPP